MNKRIHLRCIADLRSNRFKRILAIRPDTKKQKPESFRTELEKLVPENLKAEFTEGMYKAWPSPAAMKQFAELVFSKVRRTLKWHHATSKIYQVIDDVCPPKAELHDVAHEIAKCNLPATEDGFVAWKQLLILQTIEQVFWEGVPHEVLMFENPSASFTNPRTAMVQASANARTR